MILLRCLIVNPSSKKNRIILFFPPPFFTSKPLQTLSLSLSCAASTNKTLFPFLVFYLSDVAPRPRNERWKRNARDTIVTTFVRYARIK